MNFAAEKPIYLQIVDVIADRILSGDLRGGDRIPSVREYGADIGVNPNTMMRSYEKLTAGRRCAGDRPLRPAEGIYGKGVAGHPGTDAAARDRFLNP